MQYVKTAENKWLLTELEGKEKTLSLQTVDLSIQLSELYEQVDLTNQEE
jgi:hypothetical protein